MLSVRLLVKSRLLLVKFWGVNGYARIFNLRGAGVPNSHVIQGSTVFSGYYEEQLLNSVSEQL